MNLNQILLIGNAGRDAEMRFTQNGSPVTNFSMAVNRRYQANGEWQEETEWFGISVWGDAAERVADLQNRGVRRGDSVFVDGRLSTREYTNQQGVTRTSLDVNAFRVINLTPREQEGEQQSQNGTAGQGSANAQQQAETRQDPREASREVGQQAAPPTNDDSAETEPLDW